jgi:hypothetical protein
MIGISFYFLQGNKMGNDDKTVAQFFLAVIFFVLVAAYVAAHKLPLIWHLLDLIAFFAVLQVNVKPVKPRQH